MLHQEIFNFLLYCPPSRSIHRMLPASLILLLKIMWSCFVGFVFNHFALLMGWSLCFVPDHCHLPERRGGVFFVSHHSKQCWGPSGFDRGYSHPSQGRFRSPSSRLWCRAQSSLAQPAPVLEQRPWPCGHCSLFLQLCTC